MLSPSELKTLSPPEWLIDGFLPAAGFAFMYGAPGAGKSFVALDIAMSVAAGRMWGGKDTDQGGALYIVGEGAIGITQRVAAWEKAHGNMKADDMRFLLQPVDASDQQMIDKLKRTIETKMRTPPALIVADTLARCFGSSDENSAKDMNTFIRHLDEVRMATGAAIMVIHHSGKDLDRGERGSSALRGAADTILKLQGKEGLITLECDKQKDGKPFEPLGLKLRSVDLPDGSSCVVDVDGVISDVAPSLGGKQRKVLIALIALEDARIANDNDNTQGTKRRDWINQAEGIKGTTFDRAVDVLMDRELVEKVAHGIYEPTAEGFFQKPVGDLSKYEIPAEGILEYPVVDLDKYKTP